MSDGPRDRARRTTDPGLRARRLQRDIRRASSPDGPRDYTRVAFWAVLGVIGLAFLFDLWLSAWALRLTHC